jgi:putative ABC transport system substrate-binding protein
LSIYLDTSFANVTQGGAGALVVGTGAFLTSQRDRLVKLAAHYGLATIHAQREDAIAGAVMSYGTSQSDAYRQAGIYAGRILKGETPADMPKFELVVNVRTAKSLGRTIPESLLARADEVIE